MTNNGNEPNLTLSDLYDKDVVYVKTFVYIESMVETGRTSI